MDGLQNILGQKTGNSARAINFGEPQGMPHLDKLKALQKLREMRLRQAFKASETLHKFEPEADVKKPISPPPAKDIEPTAPPPVSESEVERINNLPNLSPQIFEVLLKSILPHQKPKPKNVNIVLGNAPQNHGEGDTQNPKPPPPSFEDRLKASL